MDLVRFSHTVFALPFALGSLWLATEGHPGWFFTLKIILCMVFARNAAMAFNRLADKEIDARNPRTQMRHLVSGALSQHSVTFFFVANAFAFVASSFWINTLCGALSIPILIVLCAYSLFKRFSWLCHLFLGLAIGLSPTAVWIAARGSLNWTPLLLSLILLFWISGFDIIYSTQDREVDEALGLYSIPVRFGQQGALQIAKALHFLVITCMVLLGRLGESFGIVWAVATLLALLLLVYIHLFRRSDSLDGMNQDFFQANSALSLLVLGACVLEVYIS